MSDILVGRSGAGTLDPRVLVEMYRFRDEVFRQRLRWQVQSHDGEERDQFDALDPTYIISRDARSTVNGCWRVLPTTGSYMLRDVFSELLQGEPAPCDPQVWELSRFAVAVADPDERAQASFSPLTFEMLRAACDFALENDVREYVTVCSVAMERLMRAVGVPLTRLGEGRAKRVGTVLSVACRIPISAQLQQVIYGRAPVPAREKAA